MSVSILYVEYPYVLQVEFQVIATYSEDMLRYKYPPVIKHGNRKSPHL